MGLTVFFDNSVPMKQKDFVNGENPNWKNTVKNDLLSLMLKDVYTVVNDIPTGYKAIKTKWVGTIESNAGGSIERYIMRVVAQGFRQQPFRDYSPNAISSPVMRFETLRFILVLTASFDLQ